MSIRFRQALFSFLEVLALFLNSGCGLKNWVHNGFKVGPNYRPFLAPVSEEWIDHADPRITGEELDLGEGWHSFNDPALDRLIEIAYQQNLSLRVAGARIEEARALRRFAAGTLFPQSQSIDGSYSRIKTPAPASSYFDQWNTDINSYRTFEQRLIYAEGNVATQTASLQYVEFRNREGQPGGTERDIQPRCSPRGAESCSAMRENRYCGF
jgi:hypothetical protein